MSLEQIKERGGNKAYRSAPAPCDPGPADAHGAPPPARRRGSWGWCGDLVVTVCPPEPEVVQGDLIKTTVGHIVFNANNFQRVKLYSDSTLTVSQLDLITGNLSREINNSTGSPPSVEPGWMWRLPPPGGRGSTMPTAQNRLQVESVRGVSA